MTDSSYYQHHLFFCANQRAAGERTCCADKNAVALRDYAKKQLKGKTTEGRVRVNQAGCLDRCELGPCLVIYPQGTWYRYVDEEDIDEIIDSHVLKGQEVARLKV